MQRSGSPLRGAYKLSIMNVPAPTSGESPEEGSEVMTYVITEPCIDVKDAACVDVCPVDCIHPRKDEPGWEAAVRLFINPDECIDCGACEPECPVNAIYPEDDVPEEFEAFTATNKEYFDQ